MTKSSLRKEERGKSQKMDPLIQIEEEEREKGSFGIFLEKEERLDCNGLYSFEKKLQREKNH